MPVNIDIVTGTLTVGTTAISGGSSGRVLYDNGGTLGEFGETASGALRLSSDGAFSGGSVDPAPTILALNTPDGDAYHATFRRDDLATSLGYLWLGSAGLQFGSTINDAVDWGYIDLAGNQTTLTVTNGPFNVLATGIDFGSGKFSVDANGLITTGAAGGTTGALKLKGTTSGTVTLSVADAAGTYTLKLPTTDGGVGEFLQTDGSGNTTWASAGGGLTVGTTTITSGTNGRILYNNSGTLGEYPVTGTAGSVVLSTAPTLTGPVTLTEAVGSSGLTITGATQTTSQPALNVTQTWDASGTTFNGINLNVTKMEAANASSFGTFRIAGVTSTLFGIPGVNSNVNQYPTFRQIELINGVDKLALNANNQYHCSIASVYDLALISSGVVSIDGAAAGTSPPTNLTHNGVNISRRSFLFSRHSTATGTSPAYGTATIGISAHAGDSNTSTLALYSQDAYASASTNITGGPVTIAGGAGASGAAGVASGGSIYLDGGRAYGTGVDGNIYVGNTRGNLQFGDGRNVVIGTSTGTKLGTATSQKIGFWNTTPIVQPTTAVAAATFAANTSGIANDSATFDGYTIGQVVKALRNTGLLA